MDEYYGYSQNDFRYYSELRHHGRMGQKWGVRNGPPYPLNSATVSRKYGKNASSLKPASTFPPKKETVASATIVASKLPVKMKPMSRVEDAKAVNPNYSPHASLEYKFNCVNCTAAYELRRRGYDVQARGSKEGQEMEYLESLFDGMKKTGVQPVKSIKDPYEVAKHSYEKIEKRILKQGEGARGNFMISWDPWSGHAVSYEVHKGKIILIDSQSGDVYNDPFKDMIQYSNGELYAIRLDNLKFNPKEIEKAVQGR